MYEGTMGKPHRIFRWASFTLDESRFELRHSGVVCPLQSTPFRLLVYLLEQADRVISKAEVMEAVWPDVAVGDAALSTALKEIRQALADDGEQQRCIRTFRGRGYQLAGPVDVDELPSQVISSESAARFHGVPRGLSMSFVGRDVELQRLVQLLTTESHVSVHASVAGLAGIGKTELALQAVHHLAHAEAFPGGMFWLDAEGVDLTPQWASTIADSLDLSEGPAAERCKEALRHIHSSRERTLMVLDNVEQWDATSMPAPLPHGPHVVTLVTTRQRQLGGPRFLHFELGFLEPPHDRALIEQVAGRTFGTSLEPLLELLGGHALALELVGAFLATYPSETPSSYLQAFSQARDATEREVSARVRYNGTVDDALRAIWARLDEMQKRAWQLAACFEPEPVTSELAAICGLTPPLRLSLESRHLVRATPGGWVMHRLIRDFGRRAGSEQELAAAQARFVGGCLTAISAHAGGSTLRQYMVDRPHFDAAIAQASRVLDSRSELLLLRRIGWARVVGSGYAADDVAELFSRASRIATLAGENELVLWALEGLWTQRISRSAWDAGATLAASIQELATRNRLPDYQLMARYVSGITHLYTGQTSTARAELDSVISIFEDLGSPPFFSSIASVLVHDALATCLLGDPDLAVTFAEEAVGHMEQRDNPGGLGMICTQQAVLAGLRRDLQALEQAAARADAISEQNDLAIFRRFSRIMRAWSAFYQGRSDGRMSIDLMLHEFAELDRLYFKIQRPLLLSMTAEICRAIDSREIGLRLVREGLQIVETAHERMAEPELWRHLAAFSDGPDERTKCLERGLEIAECQHSWWWALRCATDLCEHAPGEPTRARLAAICAHITSGLDLPDVRRARVWLSSA
jgi:DNA-binding winged helix-turn-helix (wHTH) protein